MTTPLGRFLALFLALSITPAWGQQYVTFDLNSSGYTATSVNALSSPYQAGSGTLNGQPQALSWQGTTSSVVNLTPTGFKSAVVTGLTGLNGQWAVGYGTTTAGKTFGLVWQLPDSAATLTFNPNIGTTPAALTQLLGVSGDQIVGYAQDSSGINYAYLWTGSASSYVHLHPLSGYVSSTANATNGSQQVGFATVSGGYPHAMKWSGTAASAVDLNPTGFAQSVATGISSANMGGVIVGYAESTAGSSSARAYVWTSSGPQSLHPAGYTNSFATAIWGNSIVGYGTNSSGQMVALLWQGLNPTPVNLSTFLPSGATNGEATSIDASGNIGGFATINGQTHATFWQPQVAPTFLNSPLNTTVGQNIAYNYTFNSRGTPRPIVSLILGSFPAGLRLSSTGYLSGTPTQTGTFTGTVMASNGISPYATQSFSITVIPTPATQYSTVGSFAYNYGYSCSWLCPDGAGNLYATMPNGGSASRGTLVEMQPSVTYGNETLLHTFGDGTVTNDGAQPNSLIPGPNGVFYGTSWLGGATGNGNVYSYSSGTVTVLHQFQDGTVANDGGTPPGHLVLATDGNLYGVTAYGGASGNRGTVFKMTPTGSETLLHLFGDGSVTNDGYNPEAPLMQASDGNFYGTTYWGGSTAGGGTGYGSVFCITPTGSVTILHGFGDGSVSNDGRTPISGLTEGMDGALYGMTSAGGMAGKGTVFRLTTSGQYTILHNIGDGTVNNDISGVADLVQGPDGNFYGTTEYGGSANEGALFMMTPTGSMLVLHSFGDGTPNEGLYPTGNLLLAPDGSFYGATNGGGDAGEGTIFKFSISSAPVLTSGSPPLTATAGQAFNFTFTALGSPEPTFSITSGNLPPGLTLSSSGVLSGSPTQDGTYTFTVTASNGVGSPVSQTVTFTIVDQATDTPVMPPWGSAMLAALLVVAAIFKPRMGARS